MAASCASSTASYQSALLATGAAHVHRPRHVRTIAAQYNTGIHYYKSTARNGLDWSRGRAAGLSVSRRNDGVERHAIGARLSCSKLQPSGDLRFPGTGLNRMHCAFVHGRAKPTASRRMSQLVRVLDQALAHDEPGGRLPCDFLVTLVCGDAWRQARVVWSASKPMAVDYCWRR